MHASSAALGSNRRVAGNGSPAWPKQGCHDDLPFCVWYIGPGTPVARLKAPAGHSLSVRSNASTTTSHGRFEHLYLHLPIESHENGSSVMVHGLMIKKGNLPFCPCKSQHWAQDHHHIEQAL